MNIIGLVLFALAFAQQGAVVGKVDTTFDKLGDTVRTATVRLFAAYPARKAAR